MLGALFLFIAFIVLTGAIFMFSLLFSGRHRMRYGYPRRRSFISWFLGRPFIGGDYYEGRPHHDEHHHRYGGGFGGGHHHGGGFGGGHH